MYMLLFEKKIEWRPHFVLVVGFLKLKLIRVMVFFGKYSKFKKILVKILSISKKIYKNMFLNFLFVKI